MSQQKVSPDVDLTIRLRQESEDPVARSSLAGSSKTFPSLSDLGGMPDRTIPGSGGSSTVNIDLGPLSDDGSSAITDSEWLERTLGLDEMKLTYEIGEVKFLCSSRWEDSEDGTCVLRKVQTDCKLSETQGLQLVLCFSRISNAIQVIFEGTDGANPPLRFSGKVEKPPGPSSRTDLRLYSNSVSTVIESTVSSKPGMDWVTSDMMAQYAAGIEKVLSATLQALGRRPQEVHHTTCDANCLCHPNYPAGV